MVIYLCMFAAMLQSTSVVLCATEGSSRFPYLSRLPSASVLRQRCLACPHSWLFKDRIQSACEALEDILSYAGAGDNAKSKKPYGGNTKPQRSLHKFLGLPENINENYGHMNSILLGKPRPTWEDDTRWSMNISEADWHKLSFSEQREMAERHRWRISRERRAFYTLCLIVNMEGNAKDAIFTESHKRDMIKQAAEYQKNMESSFETESNPEQPGEKESEHIEA